MALMGMSFSRLVREIQRQSKGTKILCPRFGLVERLRHLAGSDSCCGTGEAAGLRDRRQAAVGMDQEAAHSLVPAVANIKIAAVVAQGHTSRHKTAAVLRRQGCGRATEVSGIGGRAYEAADAVFAVALVQNARLTELGTLAAMGSRLPRGIKRDEAVSLFRVALARIVRQKRVWEYRATAFHDTIG